MPAALLPQLLEKILQQGAAFFFQKTPVKLRAVADGQGKEIAGCASASSSGIIRAIYHCIYMGIDNGPCTHRARL